MSAPLARFEKGQHHSLKACSSSSSLTHCVLLQPSLGTHHRITWSPQPHHQRSVTSSCSRNSKARTACRSSCRVVQLSRGESRAQDLAGGRALPHPSNSSVRSHRRPSTGIGLQGGVWADELDVCQRQQLLLPASATSCLTVRPLDNCLDQGGIWTGAARCRPLLLSRVLRISSSVGCGDAFSRWWRFFG